MANYTWCVLLLAGDAHWRIHRGLGGQGVAAGAAPAATVGAAADDVGGSGLGGGGSTWWR